MKTVWFVGSNPSKKNNNPLLPFWGTKSYETLKKWMETLGVNRHGLINVSNEVTEGEIPEITSYDLFRLKTKLAGESRVIALGNTASMALSKVGISHFKMPHPSGRNRKLNNPKFVAEKLEECRKFLNMEQFEG